MAEAISLEMGAPMDWATDVQTGSGQAHLEDFIIRLKEFNFDEHFDQKSNNHICYEPIGVCGLITPWNWPINQIALKVVPAFATGCTMILKPSEIAPISGMLFAEMIDEVGFPDGVFNLVNGDGAGEHKYQVILILIWFLLQDQLVLEDLFQKMQQKQLKEFV